jgi:hypothetical protein
MPFWSFPDDYMNLFPNGIDITETIPAENDTKFRSLLKTRKPLFEAGFLH